MTRRYAALGLLLALGLTGCTVEDAATPPSADSASAEPATTRPDARRATVLAQLDTLAVKGRAPRTDYDRDHFGRGWKDPDRNGCDARNDILRRDLEGAVAKPGTQGCVILSGHLEDPFTGESIEFVRGQDTSTEVQIDHVVSAPDTQRMAQVPRSPRRRHVDHAERYDV